MNRKKLVLYILIGLLAVAVGRAILHDPHPAPPSSGGASAPSPASPPLRSEAQGEVAPADEGVRLDLLDRKREPYPGARRDLFASLYKEKPAASPAMPALPPPPPLPPFPVPPPPPALPQPPPQPGLAAQQELARFTYLGFLEKKGVKTIFLSANEEIFVVKQGDTFGRGRQFQVTQITPDRLVVRQESDSRPITIPLVEQAPLAPARVAPGRFGAPRSGFPGGVTGGGFPGGMPGGGIPGGVPGGGISATMSGGISATMSGGGPPQDDFVPEEVPPAEESPEEEVRSPFVSPGSLGSPGFLQPLQPGPAAAPRVPPPPGPAFNQPAR